MGLKKQIYEAGSGNEGEPDKLWESSSDKPMECTSDKVSCEEQSSTVPRPVRKARLAWLIEVLRCMAIRMMIYVVKCVCSNTYGDSCVIRSVFGISYDVRGGISAGNVQCSAVKGAAVKRGPVNAAALAQNCCK